MIARLRSFWIGLNGSYWFYPALFSLGAVMLSFLTVWLDRIGQGEWLHYLPWFVAAKAEGARTILTVIAGSMIGVASTVFSITIAAVAYASGNYGPRLLTNFMNDRGDQLSLATFIATFVYSVAVLRVVRAPEETTGAAPHDTIVHGESIGFVPQLSIMMATLFIVLSVAVLVYFLHHVPASIRIHGVLKSIGGELLEQIRNRFPVDESGREPLKLDAARAVLADKVGYVQIIDFHGLGELAEDEDLRVALAIRPGDFVHGDVALLQLCEKDMDDDRFEKLQARLRDCFSIGGLRTPSQDIEFLIDELVEICLRALSPGINDPFTAITAMHWAGAAMAEIAGRGLDRGPEADGYDPARIFPLADDFDHFLRRSFGSMRSSVATSPLAAGNFLTCLRDAALGASNAARIGKVRAEGDTLLEQARIFLSGPDLAELESAHTAFAREMAVLVARAGDRNKA